MKQGIKRWNIINNFAIYLVLLCSLFFFITPIFIVIRPFSNTSFVPHYYIFSFKLLHLLFQVFKSSVSYPHILFQVTSSLFHTTTYFFVSTYYIFCFMLLQLSNYYIFCLTLLLLLFQVITSFVSYLLF